MTTESKEVGHLLAEVLSDVQSDTKRAIAALAVSLYSAGHLDPQVLRNTAQKMLNDIPNRSQQNSGILELLLETAQTLESGVPANV